MRNLTCRIAILALAAAPGYAVFAASEDDDPKPIPVSADDRDGDDHGLSLPLYRSLRSQWIFAFENASTDTVANDKSPLPSADAAKLRDDVRSHEPELIAALNAKQALQRELAAKVLLLAQNKKAVVAALSQSLANDHDESVRLAAAVTLAKLSDAESSDALLAGIVDSSEKVRTVSVMALGALKDERAIEPLFQILRSELNPLIRLQAAVSLGRIKTQVDQQALADILESETDERVKMALAAAIRAISGGDATFTDIPEQTDFQKQLAELSASMKNVEDKLRDDRHDETVQVDQKGIDDKLSQMIREMENLQRVAQVQKQNCEREREKQRRLEMMGRANSNRPSGRAGKLPGEPSASQSAINARSVIGRNERWASLPPKDRDELLQVFRPEVPLRWRKRLEAYFVSIAAEEARDQSQPRDNINGTNNQ